MRMEQQIFPRRSATWCTVSPNTNGTTVFLPLRSAYGRLTTSAWKLHAWNALSPVMSSVLSCVILHKSTAKQVGTTNQAQVPDLSDIIPQYTFPVQSARFLAILMLNDCDLPTSLNGTDWKGTIHHPNNNMSSLNLNDTFCVTLSDAEDTNVDLPSKW